MKLQESGEMYLETIHVLSMKNGVVKSIDVANELEFSRASVSRAMKLLEENDYITLDNKKNITLTQKGLDTALRTYECHKILTEVLIDIGVPKEIAESDACKMEHVISDETIACIRKRLNK